jgi:hypothetical protein
MLQALIPLLGTVLDKVLPDPQAAAAAKLKMLELAQSGEMAQITGQLEVNKAEAQSLNVFVAGWRPFIGWTCGVTVAFKYVIGPLLVMVAKMTGHDIPLPEIDASELWPVLMGMLGLGGMRTMEKMRGAEGNR